MKTNNKNFNKFKTKYYEFILKHLNESGIEGINIMFESPDSYEMKVVKIEADRYKNPNPKMKLSETGFKRAAKATAMMAPYFITSGEFCFFNILIDFKNRGVTLAITREKTGEIVEIRTGTAIQPRKKKSNK